METKQIAHDLTMALINNNVVTKSSPCELVSEYNRLFAIIEDELKSQHRNQSLVDIPNRESLNGL